MSTLDGVRLKIDRAGEHRETFERELIAFFEHEPERAIAKFDEQRGGFGIELRVPLPDRWSCIIGDFLQNLRNALDHFVWAAALRMRAKPDRKISFPITRDLTEWNAYLERREAKITKKAVSDAVWKCIADMQPHATPRPDPDPNTDPLWALNEFARVDRHRTLHVAVALQQGTRIGFGPLPRRGNVIAWDTAPFVLDPNERWARFTTPPLENDPRMGGLSLNDTQVATYGQVAFEIVMNVESPVGGVGWVSDLLTALFESMQRYYLPMMEAAFNA